MFTKVLIACRGASALRVLQACRELGIRTVAVHSRVDAPARAVRLADESFYVGRAEAAPRSPFAVAALLTAARLAGADAIHPGSGPLATDPDFAEICADHRLVLIGASAGGLACAGNRARTKGVLRAAGLAVVPGPAESADSFRQADDAAHQVGYPVVLKPVVGHEGAGSVVVRRRDELEASYHAARERARRPADNGRVYVEKFLPGCRRVEVQVLCDRQGRGVHLGERHTCVRHKGRPVVVEAPADFLSPRQRDRVGQRAVRAARAARVVGVATVEFLLDEKGNAFFLELHPRLSAGHPATEMRSGRDVVQEQLRLAAGEPLRFTQGEVRLSGHAFTCDVRVPDAGHGAGTRTGLVRTFSLPCGAGTRVDTDLYPGCTFPPSYEPSVARVTVWAESRPGAVERMRRALRELTIEGIQTTAPVLYQALWPGALQKGEEFLTERPVAEPEPVGCEKDTAPGTV